MRRFWILTGLPRCVSLPKWRMTWKVRVESMQVLSLLAQRLRRCVSHGVTWAHVISPSASSGRGGPARNHDESASISQTFVSPRICTSKYVQSPHRVPCRPLSCSRSSYSVRLSDSREVRKLSVSFRVRYTNRFVRCKGRSLSDLFSHSALISEQTEIMLYGCRIRMSHGRASLLLITVVEA